MIDTLVVIPTFNEFENIEELLEDLIKLKVNILVVDDNSPDNTSSLVKKQFLYNERIFLIERPEKFGLGSAYRDGFKWALNNNYKFIVEMDADFSHSTRDLKKLLTYKKLSDVVIGSRYIENGKIEGWSKSRYILSKSANIFSRIMTFCPIYDMTSGFRIYSDYALEKIQFQKTSSNGYGFQIEMTVLSTIENLSIKEVPITFTERREGLSKMSNKIIYEALLKVFALSILRIKYLLTTTK